MISGLATVSVGFALANLGIAAVFGGYHEAVITTFSQIWALGTAAVVLYRKGIR